jgi:formamidopyrimidine-DNA glycosylase
VPELPEVETVRGGLQRHVSGRTIDAVQVLHPRVVRRYPAGPEDFAAVLRGSTLGDVRRRGKYLWVQVDRAGQGGRPPVTQGGAGPGGRSPETPDALVAHLGMSGQLVVGPPDRPLTAHVRARLTFTDGDLDLRFVDQRTFGHLLLAPGGASVPAPLAHIAPDPLEPAFDDELFAARLRKRRTGLKRALLDQSLISGVGNIYADESLWRAKLHWAKATDVLRRGDVFRLLTAIREVFTEAIGAGGTSFDSLYVRVNGESGYFETDLAVYGRQGKPCPRCGAPVRREKFMNRSSFSCPKCQPRPRQGRW